MLASPRESPSHAIRIVRFVPDWILSTVRIAISPLLWVRRSLRKHFADKQKLVREGARVVTPVIESARDFNPGSVVWGNEDAIREKMNTAEEAWFKRRFSLLVYANQHPSDAIRTSAHE